MVQKCVQKGGKKCPTGKKKFLSWEIKIFQLENKILPTGHFQLSDWIFTVNHICKRFSLHFILPNHLILHEIMSRK